MTWLLSDVFPNKWIDRAGPWCSPDLTSVLLFMGSCWNNSVFVKTTFLGRTLGQDHKCNSWNKSVDCIWNVMAHAQKPDFVFRRNGRVHLNRQWRQFSRLLAAEVCASALLLVVMLDTQCSKEVWRVLATHSIRQFPLHFPSRASPCAITFQLDSNNWRRSSMS